MSDDFIDHAKVNRRRIVFEPKEKPKFTYEPDKQPFYEEET